MAAAVAFYGALAIIVFWHKPQPRSLAVLRASPRRPAPRDRRGTSQSARGMHHLSDVAAGATIGLLSLLVTYTVVRNGPAAAPDENRSSHPWSGSSLQKSGDVTSAGGLREQGHQVVRGTHRARVGANGRASAGACRSR